MKAQRGSLPFESLYTAGIAGQHFLEAIKEKQQIVATRCNGCDMTYVPPRHYCERCMAGLQEYITMPNRGVVVTQTTVHIDLDGKRLDKPQAIAAVQLDGASTVLVHRLLGKAKIGSKVKIAFESKRKGSILDIKGFEPI